MPTSHSGKLAASIRHKLVFRLCFYLHPKEEVNLGDALKKLLPLAHEWKSIATCLNVPESVLNSVSQEEKTVGNCLRAILAYRIHNMDRPLTWFQLADATDPFDASKANELRAIANASTPRIPYHIGSRSIYS